MSDHAALIRSLDEWLGWQKEQPSPTRVGMLVADARSAIAELLAEQPAPRHIPNGRCCWVCGKPGGSGFTSALRIAGYDIPRGQIGYAHSPCMSRALKGAAHE